MTSFSKLIGKAETVKLFNKIFEEIWQQYGPVYFSRFKKRDVKAAFAEVFQLGHLRPNEKGEIKYQINLNDIVNELICKRGQEIYECQFMTAWAILSTETDLITGDKIERQLPTATSGFQYQADFIDQLDKKREMEKLNELVTKKERQIIRLHQEGYRPSEIARQTSTPESTVRDFLRRHKL